MRKTAAIEREDDFNAALDERLTGAWDWRKANPAVLKQPQQQWPDLMLPAAGQPQVFVGYAPVSHPY